MIDECSAMDVMKMDILDIASSLWEINCPSDVKSFSFHSYLCCGCAVSSLSYVNGNGEIIPVMIEADWAEKIAKRLNLYNANNQTKTVSRVHVAIMSTGAYQLQFK